MLASACRIVRTNTLCVLAIVRVDRFSASLFRALAQDNATRKLLMPWFRNSMQMDRQLHAQMTAAIDGRPLQPPPGPPDPAMAIMRDMLIAMAADPDAFRAHCEMTAMLALPHEILAPPGFAAHVQEAAAGQAAALRAANATQRTARKYSNVPVQSPAATTSSTLS